MPGGYAIDLERIVKNRCDALDFFLRGKDEVEAAGHRVESRIDLRGFLENLLHARVRAADHNGESLGGAKSERNLVHLQCTWLLRSRRQNKHARKDLDRFRHNLEVSLLPRRPRDELFWRFAVVVAQLSRKAWLRREERQGHGRLEDRTLLRRVELDVRVDLEQVGETARMVSMAVGDDNRVETLEVDTELLGVMFENLSVVASVKENPLPAVLYERGKAPVSYQR